MVRAVFYTRAMIISGQDAIDGISQDAPLKKFFPYLGGTQLFVMDQFMCKLIGKTIVIQIVLFFQLFKHFRDSGLLIAFLQKLGAEFPRRMIAQ